MAISVPSTSFPHASQQFKGQTERLDIRPRATSSAHTTSAQATSFAPQHYITNRYSAPKENKDNTLAAAVLADDFETWWSSFTWKWSAGKKETVDLLHATKFPLPIEERVAQRIANRGLSTLPPTPPAIPSPVLNPRQIRRQGIETPTRILPPRTQHPALSMKTEYFEVKRSANKGYGAFALKEITEGTVIMAEAPLFRCLPAGVTTAWYQITREQRAEYATLAFFNDLHPGNRTMAIYKTNRFETTDHLGGIFLKCSRFNHACHPFATCKFYYDGENEKMVITTCKDIKKGQEVTISYTTEPTNLPGDYGFYCDCPACPPPAVARARADVNRGPW